METTIENQEIKGMTLKQFLLIIGGICSVLFTVVMSYAGIINNLEKSSTKVQELDAKTYTVSEEVKALRLQVQALEIKTARYEGATNFK